MSETENEAQATAPQFNSAKQFKVPILSGIEKRCIVRFPTDQEWCDRARKQRTIVRLLGRGKSESSDMGAEAASEDLFKKIRIDTDGPEFDAAEAGAVIERLERCSVVDTERTGSEVTISLKVPGGQVSHTLRIPTQAQLQAHGRSSISVVNARRSREIRATLEPSGELFDKLAIAERTQGYAGPVPIIHKVAAVTELLAELGQAEDETDPEV